MAYEVVPNRLCCSPLGYILRYAGQYVWRFIIARYGKVTAEINIHKATGQAEK
jgi:hypothetical protein